jgi:hypothetical protein
METLRIPRDGSVLPSSRLIRSSRVQRGRHTIGGIAALGGRETRLPGTQIHLAETSGIARKGPARIQK